MKPCGNNSWHVNAGHPFSEQEAPEELKEDVVPLPVEKVPSQTPAEEQATDSEEASSEETEDIGEAAAGAALRRLRGAGAQETGEADEAPAEHSTSPEKPENTEPAVEENTEPADEDAEEEVVSSQEASERRLSQAEEGQTSSDADSEELVTASASTVEDISNAAVHDQAPKELAQAVTTADEDGDVAEEDNLETPDKMPALHSQASETEISAEGSDADADAEEETDMSGADQQPGTTDPLA